MDKPLKPNDGPEKPHDTTPRRGANHPVTQASGTVRPRPTLRTIAEHTGFAVATVSRALAGDPKIARRTRETIARAAEDLGYVPDRAAQRLRTGRTNVIALVLDPHGEIIDFSGSMIAGFAEAVRDTRYHLTLTQYQYDEDPMRPIRHIVRNRLADGVVFARTEHEDARVRFLQEAGFPFVTHGRTRIADHAWFDYGQRGFRADCRRAVGGAGSAAAAADPANPALHVP